MSPFVLEPTLVSLDSLRELEALCLFVPEDERPLGGVAGLVDWRLCGALTRQLRTGYFAGRPDERLLMPSGGRLPVARVFAVGLGPSRSLTSLGLDHAVAAAGQMLERAGVKSVALAPAPPGALRLDEVATVLRRSFLERTTATSVGVFAEAPLAAALGLPAQTPARSGDAAAPPEPSSGRARAGAAPPRVPAGASQDTQHERRTRWHGVDRGPSARVSSPGTAAARSAGTPEQRAGGVSSSSSSPGSPVSPVAGGAEVQSALAGQHVPGAPAAAPGVAEAPPGAQDAQVAPDEQVAPDAQDRQPAVAAAAAPGVSQGAAPPGVEPSAVKAPEPDGGAPDEGGAAPPPGAAPAT